MKSESREAESESDLPKTIKREQQQNKPATI